MKATWRIPFILVSSATLALPMSLGVLGVILVSILKGSALWNTIALIGLYGGTIGFIAAWVLIARRRLREQDSRDRLLTNAKEWGLSILALMLSAAWVTSGAAMLPRMEGLVPAYVLMALVAGPWVFIVSMVWYWWAL